MPDDSGRIDALATRVAELEAENEALREENKDLRFEGDELDRQVAELEDELERLSTENADDEREREIAELEHEIESLRDANAELEADVADTEARDSENTKEGSGLGSDEERVYLASKMRKHFHRPGCEWAKCIPDYNLLEFSSHREAVAAGYKPCKTCRA